MNQPTQHRRGIILMLTSALCFTANALFIRALGTAQDVDVWLLSCVRFVVGLGLIWVVYPIGPKGFQPKHLCNNRLLITRGILGGLSIYGFYFTIVHLGAGRATFINNTYVIMGGLLAVVILSERFRASLLGGSLLALTGLALITNTFVTDMGISFHDLIAILVALIAGLVIVIIRKLHTEGEHTATIFAAQCVFGLFICFIPALANWAPHTPMAWILMIVAGLCSGIGQISMTNSFRHLAVGEGALIQMLVPLGVASGGILFYQEHFAIHEIVGAALILIGTTVPALRHQIKLRPS
jgi:drug/metabolite transporter (DMT)-like permease